MNLRSHRVIARDQYVTDHLCTKAEGNVWKEIQVPCHRPPFAAQAKDPKAAIDTSQRYIGTPRICPAMSARESLRGDERECDEPLVMDWNRYPFFDR